MLGISYSYRKGFVLSGIDAEFPRSTHTAIVGATGCGSSTLVRLIAGELRPAAGEIRFGTRVVNRLPLSRRPVLYVTDALDVPLRWSVQHALIAAVRRRSLDRIDRQREVDFAASRWNLRSIEARSLQTLSSGERLRVRLARIELLKPALLVADRLFGSATPGDVAGLADMFYRLLRSLGTTLVSVPAYFQELAVADRVVVLDRGRVAQSGTPADVYAAPASEAAAAATGYVNAIPVTVRGRTVESAIGSWEVSGAPFQGSGLALARPEDFAVAQKGEESDLVFAIEEAGFTDGRWMARGILTGNFLLQIALPRGAAIHKGRLLPLRYDPKRFTLIGGF